MEDKRDVLYKNLMSSGKVTLAQIGSIEQFKSSIKDEGSARLFHKNLLGVGFTQEEIGSDDDFFNSIIADFKPAEYQSKMPGTLDIGGKSFSKDELLKPAEITPIDVVKVDSVKPVAPVPAKVNPDKIYKEMEEKTLDSNFKPLPANSYENIRENYFSRFSLTDEGKQAQVNLSETQKDFTDMLSAEMKASPAYKEIISSSTASADKDTALQALWAKDYQPIWDQKLQPFINEYNTKFLSRYGNQMNKDIENMPQNNIRNSWESISGRINEYESELDDRKGGWKNVGPLTFESNVSRIGRETSSKDLAEKQRQVGAARSMMESSQKMIEAADAEANSNFFEGLGRGLKDEAFNLDNWSMGLKGMADGQSCLNVLEKYEKGHQLTKEEELLMDAMVSNAATKAYFQSELGRGYKAGSVTGMSLPFMVDMLTGVAAVSAGTKAALKGLMKWIAKNYTKNAVQKNIAKGITGLSKGVVDTAIHTVSFGMGRVADDYTQREIGNVEFEIEGEPKYAGCSGSESGVGTLAKSVVSTGLETQSELIGNQFAPALNFVSRQVMKLPGLRNIPAANFGKYLKDMYNSASVKGVREFAKRAQFQGPVAEYAEEVYNNLGSVAIGDMTPEQLVDLDQNIDTFLGVGVMSAAFGAVGTGSFIREKYKTSKEIKSFEEKMQEHIDFDRLRADLQQQDINGARDFVKQVMADTSLSPEKKQEQIKYIANVLKESVMNSASAEIGKESLSAEDIEESKSVIYSEFETTRKNLESKLPKELVSLIDTGKDINSILYTSNLSEEQRDAIVDYQASRNDFEDYLNNVRVKITDAKESARREVEGISNPDMGAVIRVNSNLSPEPLHIVGGTLAFDENGFVDQSKSSETIFYVDENGKRKMAAPSTFVSLVDMNDVESIAQQAEQDAEQQILDSEQSQLSQEEISTDKKNIELEARSIFGNDVIDELDQDIYDDFMNDDIPIPIDENQKEILKLYWEYKTKETPVEDVNRSNALEEEQVRSAPIIENFESSDLSTQQQTITDSDTQNTIVKTPIPSIPRNEKGEMLYHKAPIEATLSDLNDGTLTPEEVDSFIVANREDTSKRLKKLSEKSPKIGTNKAGYLESKKAWSEKLDDLQSQLDYWNEIESQMKSLREKPGDQIADEILSMEEPLNGEELAAQSLANGNIKLLSDSFVKETGFGQDEAKKYFGLFAGADKGGMSIQEAGEVLMQTDRENVTNFFDQSDPNVGRDAIINVLSQATTRGDLANIIKNNRTTLAERERKAEYEAYEQWCEDNYHMTPKEYESYQDYISQYVINQASSITDEEIKTIFVEQYLDNNYDGSRGSNEVGTGVPEGEERAGNNAGSNILQPESRIYISEGDGRNERQRLTDEIGEQSNSILSETDSVERKEIKPIGKGPFGSIYDQFKGKSKEAIAFLIKEKGGEAIGALHHPGIGDIDLVWGKTGSGKSNGFGLSKLAKYHPEVLDNLQNILSEMEIIARSSNRINLESKTHKAAVRLEWDGINKNWLLTTFEKETPTSTDRTTDIDDNLHDLQNDTAPLQNVSVSSEYKDSNFEEKSKNNSSKVEYPTIQNNENIFDYAEHISQLHEIEKESEKVNPSPTDAQKEAGNYQKGHVKIDGFDITIENPKGGIRSGVDANGRYWSVTMNNTYGYIRGTEGADGDHIDVFLSDDPTSGNVYLVDQLDTKTGEFDEHKVMYGFSSLADATNAYLSNYAFGWQGLGAISEVSKDEFKKWIDSSNRKTKPFINYKSVKVDNAQSKDSESDASEISVDLPKADPALEYMQIEEGVSDSPVNVEYNLSGELGEDAVDVYMFSKAIKDAKQKAITLGVNKISYITIRGKKVVEKYIPNQTKDAWLKKQNPFVWVKESPDDVNFRFRESDSLSEEQSIINEAKKNGMYLKAPNGNPTNLDEKQWLQVRTKAFKDWFGDWENNPKGASKIVDNNGEPKILYHFSPKKDINIFNVVRRLKPEDKQFSENIISQLRDKRGKKGTKLIGTNIVGIWFTEDMEYSAYGENKYACFLDVKNPIVGDSIFIRKSSSLTYDKEKGVDGYIANSDAYYYGEVSVSLPEQIKSATYNNGEFSPSNDDIRLRFIGEKGATNPDMRSEERRNALDEDASMDIIVREQDEIISSIDELSESLHTPAMIIHDVNEISDENKNTEQRKRKSKGWFDSNTGEVVVVLPNASSVEDAKETIFHEVVGHHGLRKMFGKDFNTFLDNVYSNATNDIQTNINARGGDIGIATEEYLAELAERGFNNDEERSFWQKMKGFFIDMLRKVGINLGFKLSDNELRYILWKSYQNLQNDNVFDLAKNIAKQYELQVGNYRIENTRNKSNGMQEDNILYREISKKEQDLRDKITELKKSIKENKNNVEIAARTINLFVRDILSTEVAKVMGKSDILSIVAAVNKATTTQQELSKPMKAIEMIVNDAVMRKETGELNDILNLKVRDKNNKGVSVAKNVDEGTRKIVEGIRGMYSDLIYSGMEKEIRALKKRLRELKKGSIIEKHLDASSSEKIKELEDSILGLTEKSEELKQFKTADTKENLIAREKELQAIIDNTADGNAIFTHEMGIELTIIPIKLALAEIQDVQRDLILYENQLSEIARNNTELRKQHAEENKKGHTDKSILESIKGKIRENIQLAQSIETLQSVAQNDLLDNISKAKDVMLEIIEEGKNSLALFYNKKKERKRNVIAMGIRAVKHKRIKRQHESLDTFEKLLSMPIVEAAKIPFKATLNSFNYMLKVIDQNSLSGEGELYNYFMKSENGAMSSHARYYDGIKEFEKSVDEKCKEILGNKFDEIIQESKILVKKTGIHQMNMYDSTRYGKAGIKYEIEMSKGQALYTYMVWQMTDGRAKLENQGFDEESIDEIRSFIGDKYISFAEWAQEEFLPLLREGKYNKKHIEIFGTSMAEIPHYFPLSIDKKQIADHTTIGEESEGLPSTMTGSLINRTRNLKAIDTEQNAFELLMNHGDKMEKWCAYADLIQDLNSLIQNPSFRNYMEANENGSFSRFKDACKIAVMSYNIKELTDENAVLGKIGKTLAGACVSFRINTALKQVLSLPAFLSYSANPKYIAILTKNTLPLSGVTEGLKSKRVRLFSNYKWCVENLPAFRERVDKKSAGMGTFEEKGFDFADKFISAGLIPNQLIDAFTCSIGAKSIYDFAFEKYKKGGMNENEADIIARIDAQIAFNESQQSSDPAFKSTIQSSNNAFWRAAMNFQTSNIGYYRLLAESFNDMMKLKRIVYDKAKEELISNGEDAHSASIKAMKKTIIASGDIGRRFVLNGFIINMLWSVGSIGLLGMTGGMLGGDKDWWDEEDKRSIAWGTVLSPVMGTALLGNFLSAAVGGNEYNPMMVWSELTDGVKAISETIDEDGVISTALAREIAIPALKSQGIDPVTFSNMYLGIEDFVVNASNGELNSTNVLIDFMLLINSPNSQRNKMAEKLYKKYAVMDYVDNMAKAKKYYDKNDYRLNLPGTKELTTKRKRTIAREKHK